MQGLEDRVRARITTIWIGRDCDMRTMRYRLVSTCIHSIFVVGLDILLGFVLGMMLHFHVMVVVLIPVRVQQAPGIRIQFPSPNNTPPKHIPIIERIQGIECIAGAREAEAIESMEISRQRRNRMIVKRILVLNREFWFHSSSLGATEIGCRG